ncbi:uncharacterized protein V1518DRAFT_417278 [Limtongia smithiae]|uniref:uncharacterized protein n=1 Tax=Limtongia smithiae TaxID=1125753 RepID=UPI0034CE7BEE
MDTRLLRGLTILKDPLLVMKTLRTALLLLGLNTLTLLATMILMIARPRPLLLMDTRLLRGLTILRDLLLVMTTLRTALLLLGLNTLTPLATRTLTRNALLRLLSTTAPMVLMMVPTANLSVLLLTVPLMALLPPVLPLVLPPSTDIRLPRLLSLPKRPRRRPSWVLAADVAATKRNSRCRAPPRLAFTR